jgi:hypothetical protein
MRASLLFFLAATLVLAQNPCGKMVINPVTGKLDCVGMAGTAANPLSGAGVPSNPCNLVGQTYTNTTAQTFYFCPVALGNWVLLGSAPSQNFQVPYTNAFTSQTSFAITSGTHGQGSYPNVNLYDTSGNPQLGGFTVDPGGSGTVTFTFSPAFSGRYVIYNGGGQVGAFYSVGATFTAAGCGGPTSLIGGGVAGSLVAQASSCTPTITVGSGVSAALHGWSCWISDTTNPSDQMHQTGSTTTTATFTGTVAASDTLVFGCIGY